MDIYNGKSEYIRRHYDSLKNFVGENKVYKCGDVLLASSKDNGNYDIMMTADGHSTFLELMHEARLDEEYAVVMTRIAKD